MARNHRFTREQTEIIVRTLDDTYHKKQTEIVDRHCNIAKATYGEYHIMAHVDGVSVSPKRQVWKLEDINLEAILEGVNKGNVYFAVEIKKYLKPDVFEEFDRREMAANTKAAEVQRSINVAIKQELRELMENELKVRLNAMLPAEVAKVISDWRDRTLGIRTIANNSQQ